MRVHGLSLFLDPCGTLSGRGKSFCLCLYDRDIEDSDKLPLDQGGGGATERNTQPQASKHSFWNNEITRGEKERETQQKGSRWEAEAREKWQRNKTVDWTVKGWVS